MRKHVTVAICEMCNCDIGVICEEMSDSGIGVTSEKFRNSKTIQ